VLFICAGSSAARALDRRERSAYAYLSASTEGFQGPEELATIMREAGLLGVRYRRFMAGTIAVHVGMRRRDDEQPVPPQPQPPRRSPDAGPGCSQRARKRFRPRSPP